MNQRQKGFFLIIISFILLLIIIFFAIRQLTPEEPEAPIVETPQNDVPLPVSEISVADPEVVGGQGPVNTSDAYLQSELSRLAAMFTERFGTYSSEGAFDNAEDLKIFMTPALYAWSQKYFSDLKEQLGKGQEYFGVTSRSISVKMNALDKEEGSADFTITAQRGEVRGEAPATISYKLFSLKMIYDGSQWKVDFVKWM